MAATAPMTPARLRALAVCAAILFVAVGVLGGQVARRRALLSLSDVSWSADVVRVTYRDGNTPLALLALAAGLAVIGALCWLGARFASVQAFADPATARRWTFVAVALWAGAVAGAVGGWLATSSRDAIEATRVASFMAASGDDVGVVITAGEQEVVRPTGLRSTILEPPVVLEFTVDGATCAVTVDDPVTGDAGTLELVPSCR